MEMRTVDDPCSAGSDHGSLSREKLFAAVPVGERDLPRRVDDTTGVIVDSPGTQHTLHQPTRRRTSANSLSFHDNNSLTTTFSASSAPHNSTLDEFSAGHFILDNNTDIDLFGSIAPRERDGRATRRLESSKLWRSRPSEAPTSINPIHRRSSRDPPVLQRDLRFAHLSTQSDPHLRSTATSASQSRTTPISSTSKPIRKTSTVSFDQGESPVQFANAHRSFWFLQAHIPIQSQRRHSENSWILIRGMSNQPFPGEGLESTKDGKSNAIQRPLYRDLHTAYSTITSRPGFLQEFQSLHDKNVHSEEHPVVRITPSRVPSGRASSGVLAEDHEYHDGSSDLDHVEVLDHNDTTAGMSNGTLETDIARELRRVSQLSGLSGSVLLVNESHLNDSSAKELGPGSSQSSSSKARSNEVLGLSIPSMNHHYPTSDIPRMWRDTERAGMGIQGHFSKSFRPATVEDDIGDFEDEHDWVTVEENRGGHSFFDNSQAMTKHPADERYDHLYRIRQTTPNGEPMLIPQYTFEGVGFPNRNALTSPILTNPVPSNTYQHPDPLFTDHVHPFKSSPPVIMRSGDEIGTPKTKSHNRSHGIDLARSPGTLDQFDFGFSERSNNSNSFSKVTLLGPKFNVTGTPDGTGMKKAGSSLVASSTPQVPASALVTGRVHYPWDRTEGSDPGWEESVRRHREHLVAEGLLPRTATATPPGGGPGSLFSSRSSFHSLSPSTYLYAFGRPTSYNPTPPLPLNPFFQQASGLDIRLHRLPRSDAHLSPKLRKRKAWLSNAFLLLCAGFPPTWLLYGYGHLDGIMLSISRGEFEQFGKPQKLVGVVLGWASGIALIVGLIVVLVLSLG